MSTCKGITYQTGQASHIKTESRPATSCVPMRSLTTLMGFLRPTGVYYRLIARCTPMIPVKIIVLP